MSPSGRVAVVTGGNKGIGYAIVKALCKGFDGTVILAARDEARGLQAVESLKKEGLNPLFQRLDIDSLRSIEQFRDYIKAVHGGLDVLVNNAAIAYKNAATEPFSEQADVTMRVNFFGTLILCKELFPLLRKNARVVNLSGSVGHLHLINGQEPGRSELRKTLGDPNLNLDDLIKQVNNFVTFAKEGKHVEHGWPNSAYAASKVCVSALTRIQQRELDLARPDDNILVNCVHPGYVDTDMTSNKGTLTIEQGAVAPSWLALLPASATEPRGGYVWFDRQIVDWVNGPLPTAY